MQNDGGTERRRDGTIADCELRIADSHPSDNPQSAIRNPQFPPRLRPPDEIISVLASARRLVVAGHVNPDADALGSMLALARAVPSPGAAVELGGADVGQKLHFLLELADDVPVADEQRLADADVIVVLDTANAKRINVRGGWKECPAPNPQSAIRNPQSACVVNIDHHITNEDFGRHNWVVDHASSVCEMVYRLIVSAGWPIDATTATLLLAGLFADTGGFSLPNASADVFDTAADLVRAGADVSRVGSRLQRSQKPHEFDLLRLVYQNTRLAADGRIAYSTLTHDEILAAGCSPQDIDDQVSIPRSLSGVRIAILFSEGQLGVIRINLRGENGTAVLPLAQRLGGGGHTYSAGVRVRGTMDDVVARVLAEAAAALQQG